MFVHLYPNPLLSPYIECYWTLTIPAGLPAGSAHPHQMMPADHRFEMIFNFGAASRRVNADGGNECHIAARSFVLGGRSRGYSLDHLGYPQYVTIRFKSGGLSAFTRVPLIELTDIYVDLDCLWDQRIVRELEEQLAAAKTPAEQIAVLEKTLLRLLAPPPYFNVLRHSVDQLTAAQTDLTMLQLADSTNLSQKHFERLFARYIGFRPNLFARITRFQKALYTGIHCPDSLPLSQLALRTGYYDQSHFGRDFKQFSGIAPKDFFATTHDYVLASTPFKLVDSVQD